MIEGQYWGCWLGAELNAFSTGKINIHPLALPSQLWMDAPEVVVKGNNSSPGLIGGNGQSQ